MVAVLRDAAFRRKQQPRSSDHVCLTYLRPMRFSISSWVLAAVLLGCGGGDSRPEPRLYRTTFELGPGIPAEARPPSRSSSYLDLIVEDGTCGGADPEDRLERVDIRNDVDALIVTVWMKDLRPGEVCAGVGRDFVHRVKLPEPVRARAIIDAGFSDGEPWAVELEPRGRAARGELRDRFDVFN